MPILQVPLDTTKLADRLEAAKSAEWNAKWLCGQVEPEALASLKLWAETLARTVALKIEQLDILATENLRVQTAAERAEFMKKLKELGIERVPQHRPQARAAKAPSQLSDLLGDDFS